MARKGECMRNEFMWHTEDTQWLLDTHLKGVLLPTKYIGFKSFVLQGNEDSPDSVDLYTDVAPLMTADYYRVVFINEPPVYCESQEYNGKTNKPY
jgi:hypothetical protein